MTTIKELLNQIETMTLEELEAYKNGTDTKRILKEGLLAHE